MEEVVLVEQDRRAFAVLLPHLMESTRQAMEDPRLKLHFMDGRRFTNRLQPEAADDLSGALGGLVTDALLVPILAIKDTSYLLALFAIIAVLPLLHAHFAPTALPALQARGCHSFPWPGLPWGLAFLVISIGVLSFLARAAVPGPAVEFTDRVLREVSGSQQFELREMPVPHYLGSGSAAAEAAAATETLSPASVTVAADARGYGGSDQPAGVSRLRGGPAWGALRGL